jgi:hypothetical protein
VVLDEDDMVQGDEEEAADVVDVVTVADEVLVVPEGDGHLILNGPLLLVDVVDQIVLFLAATPRLEPARSREEFGDLQRCWWCWSRHTDR